MMSTAQASSMATSIEDIIDAFRGPIEPVRVPVLYDLGLLLVAVAMVLLPLLYIALILLVAYGLYFHTTQSTGVFEDGNARLAALVYFTPIVAGLILIFFMLKPLFARPPSPPLPVSLDPAEEPGIFRFVEKICATVGAPLPRRIDVDCQVNASAGFAAGFRSMFSQDLVLTVGLPLVAGLSLRELAGVLAHEFGHFAQGTGMRLTYIIRSVNNWFARVVYERDAWDEMLIEASTQGAIGLGMTLMLNAARFMVWLTRRILWVLMMAGHIISSFMLRQMEFDADRYEARVAGSTVFGTTSLKLRLLGLASQGVYSNFQNAWNQAELGDQIAALVFANYERIPESTREQVLHESLDQSTQLLDSHPADRDRIASAERERADGVFQLDIPASALFADFQAVSRRATLDFYKLFLGDEVSAGKLLPAAVLLERQAEMANDYGALDRFTGGYPLHADGFPELGEVASQPIDGGLEGVLAALQTAREHIEQWIAANEPCIEKISGCDERLTVLQRFEVLAKAGVSMRPVQIGLQTGSSKEILRAQQDTRRQREKHWSDYSAFTNALSNRLTLGILVAQTPGGMASLAGANLDPGIIPGLVAAARAFAPQAENLEALWRDCDVSQFLIGEWQSKQDDNKLDSAVRDLMGRWHAQLEGLRDGLGIAYPFEHAKGDVSISEYLFHDEPDEIDLGGLHQQAHQTFELVRSLQYRVFGRLALIVETIERAFLKLEPLGATQR